MQPESFSFKCCSCRNIEVQGQKAERLNKTGLSAALQQKIFVNKEELLQVRTGSVEIENEQLVSIRKLGESHCAIQCKKCGMILNLFYGKGNCFAQFSNNSQSAQNKQILHLTPENPGRNFRNVPKTLYSVIKRRPTDGQCCISQSSDEDESAPNDANFNSNLFDNDNNDDDDFDLMFSSATAPIVGSYTESPMAFTPEIFV